MNLRKKKISPERERKMCVKRFIVDIFISNVLELYVFTWINFRNILLRVICQIFVSFI